MLRLRLTATLTLGYLVLIAAVSTILQLHVHDHDHSGRLAIHTHLFAGHQGEFIVEHPPTQDDHHQALSLFDYLFAEMTSSSRLVGWLPLFTPLFEEIMQLPELPRSKLSSIDTMPIRAGPLPPSASDSDSAHSLPRPPPVTL